MKRWWFGLLVFAAVLVLGWRQPSLSQLVGPQGVNQQVNQFVDQLVGLFQPAVAPVSDPASAPRSDPARSPVQQVDLAVEAERLLSDLEALTVERYSSQARQQARDYIRQQLEAAGWTVQEQPFENGINLYAERLGSDVAADTVVLGAHFDTVEGSPGADDNATAIATLLEAARLFKGASPRTLQLAFFDLEEQGLLGSKVFVKQLAQPDRLRGAVILDMLGYRCTEPGCQNYPPLPIQPPTDRGDFLAALGDQGHPELLASFTHPAFGQLMPTDKTQPAASVGLPQVLTLAIPTFGGFAPDVVRSDHAPFWKAGLGAVLITDTANFRNPHYHQPSDTIATIDREFFVGAAQTVVNAVATLLQN
ncbi:MAG: M28 family peptidase [Elainella sp.]